MFRLESSSASSEISAFPSCVFQKNGEYKVCLKEEGFVDLEDQPAHSIEQRCSLYALKAEPIPYPLKCQRLWLFLKLRV